MFYESICLSIGKSILTLCNHEICHDRLIWMECYEREEMV